MPPKPPTNQDDDLRLAAVTRDDVAGISISIVRRLECTQLHTLIDGKPP
ncbi:MAG: hypothetical protein H7138_03010 [Myxococcales bacterium]|nr:hypothetical protein [Myxococcales bacterium]